MYVPSVGSLQRPLSEIKLAVGQFHAQFAEPLFVGFGKVCATRYESVECLVQQNLVGTLQRVVGLLPVMHRLHPREKSRMLIHFVFVCHQQRLHLLRHSLHLIIAIAFQDVEENVGDGGQLLPGTIQRHDSILKIRRIFLIDNIFYILLRSNDSLLKRREIMFGFDFFERRGLPQCGPVLGERVHYNGYRLWVIGYRKMG